MPYFVLDNFALSGNNIVHSTYTEVEWKERVTSSCIKLPHMDRSHTGSVVFCFFHFRDVAWMVDLPREWRWFHRRFSFNGETIWEKSVKTSRKTALDTKNSIVTRPTFFEKFHPFWQMYSLFQKIFRQKFAPKTTNGPPRTHSAPNSPLGLALESSLGCRMSSRECLL